MLLKILRALERFAAEVALVWFERDVDADVAGDVIALDGSRPATTPLTCEVEVVCALAADVALADVVLKGSYQHEIWRNDRATSELIIHLAHCSGDKCEVRVNSR
jgi:hypothetical protein